MREIEFKVYVKDKRKIYNVKEIDFDYKYVKFEEENKPTDTMRMFEDVELLEYTGLKDKNGKKIFEGDVLLFDFEDIGKQEAVVYYDVKYAKFNIKPLNDFEFALIDDGKVIGNIHDNPELLEATE